VRSEIAFEGDVPLVQWHIGIWKRNRGFLRRPALQKD
jgi:hypothetical protein